jgi:hypothetical protein
LEFWRRDHRGKLEHLLRIVWVLEFVTRPKTPVGRILSVNGTIFYQNCRNYRITTSNLGLLITEKIEKKFEKKHVGLLVGSQFGPTILCESSKTHHDGREGGRERVTICFQETTVYFSFVIDRESILMVTVGTMCDV